MLSLISRTASIISNEIVPYIGSTVLCSFNALKSVYFGNCLYIGNSAFASCYSISAATFPKCRHIGSYAFSECSRIKNLNFPQCVTINQYAFASCSISLTNVNFPECRRLYTGAFRNCKELTTAHFHKCIYIDQPFTSCSKLSSLYLNSVETVPYLETFNSNAFGTSCGLSTLDSARIYVPSSLVSEFQHELGWSFFSSKFVGV